MKTITEKQTSWRTFTMLFILLACSILNSKGEVSTPLTPFEYGEVKIEAGELLERINIEKEFFLSIPNDDLLKGFRERAGLPAPGNGLGGWYGNDIFHVFGQLVAGYSRLYAATGDEKCLEKANYLVEEWGKTVGEDGYFYYSDKPNAPHYVYEKMMGGLVDCYVYCGSEVAKQYMGKITDWAIENLDRKREFGQHIDVHNGEWYTLSENIYRAYQATGEEKFKEFAEVWEYTEFWDIVRTGGNPFERKSFFHAYSHLNSFCSSAAAYQVKEDPKYLETCMAAYEFFRNTQCYVTGGFGPAEQLKHPDALTEVFKSTHVSFEVQCSSWACFKLNKFLISTTGQAHYGDWVELLMINGIISGIPMTPEGNNYHYANYNPKGCTKENHNEGWWCCTGTRPQAFADCHNLIWYHNENDLYLSQYIPSSVEWKGLKIIQQTNFPKDNKVTVAIEGNNTASFTLSVRKPEWLAGGAVIKINNQTVDAVEKDGWLTMNRSWKGGDRIDIELPMDFEVCRMPDGQEYPAALKYGPVTMAVQNVDVYPTDILTAEKKTVEGKDLYFTVEGHDNWILRPYYTIGQGDPYFVYVDPSVGFGVSEDNITRFGNGGEWGNFVTWHCNIPGSYAEVSFEGTGIQWNGYKYDDSGMVAVSIDGVDIEVVDLYSKERDVPFMWERRNLEHGAHTLRITCLEEKNPASAGTWINYLDFVTFANEPLPIITRFGNGSTWGYSDNWHCDNPGAYVEVIFEGTGIGWHGFGFDDAGKASITLDGVEVAVADMYSKDRQSPFYWEKRGLAPGRHTLKITILEEKNEASAGSWINYVNFVYFQDDEEELSVVHFGNGSEWGNYGTWHCDMPGAWVEVTFYGEGIKWSGYHYGDAGMASITLDGVELGKADMYSSQQESPFSWEKRGLGYGKHTLRITILEEKNENSGGRWVNHLDFVILADTDDPTVVHYGNGGEWENYGTWHSNTPGAWAEVTFYGTGIKWSGFQYDDSGMASVSLNGVEIDRVDMYNIQRDTPFSWEKRGLEYGQHKLRITILEEKNANSGGTWINHLDFEIFTDGGGTGIGPVEQDSQIVLAGNSLLFSDELTGERVRIVIFNMTGQQVYTHEVIVNGSPVHLPSYIGVHLIAVYGNKGKLFTSKYLSR